MIYINMKKYIFTLILLTCSQVVFANNTCENLSFKEKISEIRKNYADINNNIYDYKTYFFDGIGNGEGSEGSEAVNYVDNKGNLVKRVETYYYETGKFLIEYYYHQGNLRFIFTVDTDYNSHISMPNFEQAQYTTSKNRYYFYCNRLIKWLDKDKKSIAPNSKKFIEKEQQLLDDMKDSLKEQELSDDMQDNPLINQDNEQVRRIFL